MGKCLALIIASLSFFPVYAAEPEEALDNWSLSGYANLVSSAQNGKPTAFELDDLSLFVSGKFNKWLNPFMEAEVYSVPLWEESRGLRFNSANLAIERLYNDLEFNDSNSLRLGKFLAPINHWNIIHAAPLVWTTNRPVTSGYAVANYITGLGAKHAFDLMSGHALEVYWQPQDEFSPSSIASHPRRYKSVYGGRWILHEGLEDYYGVAVQRAAVKNSDEIRTTLSADGNWQLNSVELESQISMTWLGTAQPLVRDKEWGGYLQLVAPIVDHFYAVGRYEHFEFSRFSKAMDTGLGGVVFRPQPKLSFKLEWQQTFGEQTINPTGLYGSIAVLF